jgi:diguanylate cyclase (GGDEF)-like protein
LVPTGDGGSRAPAPKKHADDASRARRFVLPGFDELFSSPLDLAVIVRVPQWVWAALGALGLLALLLGSALAVYARRLRRSAARAEALAGLAATRLLNRRGLETVLAVELARARRYGGQVAVVFGDLRALKMINDRYGHDVGDRALRKVAGVIRTEIREGDSAGRVGGDEYAITLANQDESGASAFCERVRRRLASTASPAKSIPLDLTMGIAVFPRDGETPADLLTAADRRLYAQRGITVGESQPAA